MSRRNRFSAAKSNEPRRRNSASRRSCVATLDARQLRLELLEDRRVLASLVGVDFDKAEGNTPSGWDTVTELVSGETLPIVGGSLFDLTLSSAGGFFFHDAKVTNNVPTDAGVDDLAKVDGVLRVNRSGQPIVQVSAVWSALTPGVAYETYVFGLTPRPDGNEIDDVEAVQRVEVNTGGQDFLSGALFDQVIRTSESLHVNQRQSSKSPLTNFAVFTEADAAGEIRINIKVSDRDIWIAGLAIREAIVVNDASGVDDGDPENGSTSAPEAINNANATEGHDTIVFDSEMAGQLIALENSLPVINGPLAIDGSGLTIPVTIDAQQNSRILDIAETAGDVTISSLKLINGLTTAENPTPDVHVGSGGLINSRSTGTLTLSNIELSNGRTEGLGAEGGAAFVEGDLLMIDSIVRDSSTGGPFAPGGGLFVSGESVITGSTVESNSTEGSNSLGGGAFFQGPATLTDTWVKHNFTLGTGGSGGGAASLNGFSAENVLFRGNEARGQSAQGGGLRNTGLLTLSNAVFDQNSAVGGGGGLITLFDDAYISGSTFSNNSATGDGAAGAGINASMANLMIVNSTVSGNRLTGANGRGAGIHAGGDAWFQSSTIYDNSAEGFGSRGGGALFKYNGGNFQLDHTILAGNTVNGQGPDFFLPSIGDLLADFSLIGDTLGVTVVATNSLVGNRGGDGAIDPMLGPLAQNGGATATHHPLPGSPVIDAGDPGAMAGENGVPKFDQRGESFLRVFDDLIAAGTGIDIGALEVQPPPSADFDGDGDVDGDDFLTWQKNFGLTEGALRADGDANGDGTVDAEDFVIWQSQFGQIAPSVAQAIQPQAAPALATSSSLTPTQADLRDMALAAALVGSASQRASDADVAEEVAAESLPFEISALWTRFRNHKTFAAPGATDAIDGTFGSIDEDSDEASARQDALDDVFASVAN